MPAASKNTSWSARFRAKNRQIDSDVLPIISDREKHLAREISPEEYLESMGYRVRAEGRHLSVRINHDEYFRCTRMPEGHWVSCDNYQNGVGDNIALVQYLEPSLGFVDAVHRLTGGDFISGATFKPKPRSLPKPPSLPEQRFETRSAGRTYLRDKRGISEQTLDHAEASGFLSYGIDSVLFVGRDDHGKPMNITRRAINHDGDGSKKDMRGSNKFYPQILAGRPHDVWIVEGGVDALALHDICIRQGRDLPSVIVSGGSNVLSFIDNPSVSLLLKGAVRLSVSCEREKDDETQSKTLAAHSKQLERIHEVRSDRCAVLVQAEQYKDLAAENFALGVGRKTIKTSRAVVAATSRD
jgi:hypothetical protein